VGILLWILAHWMPRLTRPGLFFSITVPPGFSTSPEADDIVRRYRAWVAFHFLAGLAIGMGLLWIRPEGAPLGLVWQAVGGFGAFASARKRVAPHAVAPTTVREATLTERRPGPPGGWSLQVLPLATLAATAVYLRSRWDEIPERLPVHWRLDGLADRWATKSQGSVFAPLLDGALAVALFAFFIWAILYRTRPVRAGGGAGAAEATFRQTLASVLIGAQIVVAATFIWVALLPLLHPASGWPARLATLTPVLLSLFFVALVTALALRIGQGGSRLVPREERGPSIGDRTEDRYWKAGIFYVNRNDPALFIEKRFGIGYTLNLGHPGAWGILALIVALGLASVLMTR
jgi:uncharacterized membrane protein